jgi:hypothetical protein
VFFLLVDSLAPGFYMTTFRNTVCSETSEHKIQTLENYPKEGTQHLQHGVSLKSSFFVEAFRSFKILKTAVSSIIATVGCYSYG